MIIDYGYFREEDYDICMSRTWSDLTNTLLTYPPGLGGGAGQIWGQVSSEIVYDIEQLIKIRITIT